MFSIDLVKSKKTTACRMSSLVFVTPKFSVLLKKKQLNSFYRARLSALRAIDNISTTFIFLTYPSRREKPTE